MLAEVAVSAVMWAIPPAPSPAPAVNVGPCPGLTVPHSGCYYGQHMNTIYLMDAADTQTLEHERGHAFDELALSPGERAAIQRAMGWGAWHVERFAEFYAGCRLRDDPRDPQAGFMFRPFRSVARVAARCRLIARTGA